MLKGAAKRAAELSRRRTEALGRRQLAEQAATSYTEQRDGIGSTGYVLGVHTKLKADLDAAQRAVRRSAALRESADAVQFLQGQFDQQEAVVVKLRHKVQQLREHASEVEPTDEAQQTAEANHRRIADEHESPARRWRLPSSRSRWNPPAVTAARARLERGRKILGRIERRAQAVPRPTGRCQGAHRLPRTRVTARSAGP